MQAVPPRQLAVPWIAVAALAAVAWGGTVMLARTMGNGPGTMGLALLPFLGLWVVMMAAMMLPSVAPVAVLWTRLIAGAPAGPGRPLRMSEFKGRSRDLRVGLHHGATCAGCCWGLMIVLVAVGVMNVAVMAALAVVIFAEKLWRHGKRFGQAFGVLLVAIGVLAIWFPWLLPGLHVSAMPAM